MNGSVLAGFAAARINLVERIALVVVPELSGKMQKAVSLHHCGNFHAILMFLGTDKRAIHGGVLAHFKVGFSARHFSSFFETEN